MTRMEQTLRSLGGRWMATAVLVAALGVFAACPGSSEDSGPVETCSSVGEQCRLQPGKLGVCTMDPSGELECVSQH